MAMLDLINEYLMLGTSTTHDTSVTLLLVATIWAAALIIKRQSRD
jgi:hypothetical protein